MLKSTADDDAHEKGLKYFKLPSLLAYMMISQTEYRAEVYERNAEFWKFRIIEGLGAVIDLETLTIDHCTAAAVDLHRAMISAVFSPSSSLSFA